LIIKGRFVNYQDSEHIETERVIEFFKHVLWFLALVFIGASVSSCAKKYTCSAYQSMFFVDQTATGLGYKKYDMQFDADSAPLLTASVKHKRNLLLAPVSRSKKEKMWKVVPMVFEKPPRIKLDSITLMRRDSVKKAEELLDSLEEAGEEEKPTAPLAPFEEKKDSTSGTSSPPEAPENKPEGKKEDEEKPKPQPSQIPNENKLIFKPREQEPEKE
jgi:hypothetical protein